MTEQSATQHIEYDSQEARPKAEVDVGLTELVDNIEIDTTYFANLMARKGVSASDIAATTISASADKVVKGKTNEGEPLIEEGNYDRKTHTAQINVGGIIATIDKAIEQELKHLPQEGRVDETISALVSEIAVHELSHRIDEALSVDTFQERLNHHEGLVPEKLGGKVIRKILRMSRNPEHRETADMLRKIEIAKAASKSANHGNYLDEPAEQRARQLAEEELQKFDEVSEYPISIRSKKAVLQSVG